MSKELVTIITDVPTDITPESLRRQEPDTKALIAIYKELEFKSFITRLEVQPEPEPSFGGLFDLIEEPAPARRKPLR